MADNVGAVGCEQGLASQPADVEEIARMGARPPPPVHGGKRFRDEGGTRMKKSQLSKVKRRSFG